MSSAEKNHQDDEYFFGPGWMQNYLRHIAQSSTVFFEAVIAQTVLATDRPAPLDLDPNDKTDRAFFGPDDYPRT